MASHGRNVKARGRGGGGSGGRGHKRQMNVNEHSPVIKAFRIYQNQLDSRHDRYERIVKYSRDITIESKRVIFLLQRCAGEEEGEKQKILEDAVSKLKEIQAQHFLPVALELDGQDHYQFIRAYSPGLQEYIEAVSFYHYLSSGQLITLAEVEKDLVFARPAPSEAGVSKAGKEGESKGTAVSSTCEMREGEAQAPGTEGNKAEACEVSSTSSVGQAPAGGRVVVTVPPVEFMLGIADLTGELMRTAIMSVSAGNLDYPVQICDFMRIIHDSFQAYGNTARELSRKMATLRQSLQKVESACYTLKVRGSEIPKHMLADIFTSASADEGFADDTEQSVYD